MQHHRPVLAPVKVSAWSDELRVEVLRVIGYRATCSCGWRGQTRGSIAQARADHTEHRGWSGG